MSGAQVLRVGLLKKLRGFTYEELAFHLLDSSSYRAFCGLGWGERTPRRATLQQNLAPSPLLGLPLDRSTRDDVTRQTSVG